MAEVLGSQRDKLLASYEKLSTFSTNFNVRKLAACTKQNINTFYILCGWMSEKDAKGVPEGDIERRKDLLHRGG